LTTNSDDFVSVRPVRRGDLCILLAAHGTPAPPLLKHIVALHRLLGGRPPDLIHITAQRFEPKDPSDLTVQTKLGKQLLAALQAAYSGPEGATYAAFPVQSSGYVPMHSSLRSQHLLKWIVTGSEALERTYCLIDNSGRTLGLKPLYMRRSPGARVTALLDIQPEENPVLASIPIPDPLFWVQRLLITHILGPHEFETLGEITLPAAGKQP
jgi:hypothetical protein